MVAAVLLLAAAPSEARPEVDLTRCNGGATGPRAAATFPLMPSFQREGDAFWAHPCPPEAMEVTALAAGLFEGENGAGHSPESRCLFN